MSAHETVGPAFVGLLVLAVGVLIFYFLVRWFRRSFTKLGLTPGEVGFILWATFLGAFISIPLIPFGEGWLGVNVGGGIVPLILSLYLWRRKRLPVNEVLVGVILVTVVSYLVTDYRPGVGVVSPFPLWLLPALTAFVVTAFAYWHDRDNAAALAYVVGTLGVLIGADILRIPEILAGPAPDENVILAIGGAAAFDMVYLTGILAITMETGLLVKRRHDLSRRDVQNVIDSEYEAWVEKKRREWADTRRERDERDQRAAAAPRTAPGQRRPPQEAPPPRTGGGQQDWRATARPPAAPQRRG